MPIFEKVAIANRGVVAARLVRALREMHIKSVVLHSEADAALPYVAEADENRLIGPPQAAQSYLNQEAILEAALASGAQALHPGYGFLSENHQFADRVIKAGLAFIGPGPDWLRLFGDKTASRKLMAGQGFPLGPSTGLLTGTSEEQAAQAAALGFPLLIKPAGGGGGIGMIPVYEEGKLSSALAAAASQAARGFGQAALYAERLMAEPRHVEFQIVADQKGRATHLFERDCSIQRRRQKVIEEAGAPNIPADQLKKMADQAAAAMSTLGYDQLGTVETLYHPETGFAFLEVNPRLQVEHAVTEEVTGVDLVKTQIRLAAGESLETALPSNHRPQAVTGHALEVRVYAEDPVRFLPSPGPLKVFRPPTGAGIRVETGYTEGAAVTPFYDPMVALVIIKAENRLKALDLMDRTLAEFAVEGIKTNIPFVRRMLQYEPFREGRVHTGLTDELLKAGQT